MKKTRLRNALRNIKKNFISWFAVAIVTMIGCGVFLGILFYDNSMIEAADSFYKETNYEDLEVMLPNGISDEDVNKLKDVDGIIGAEGGYSLSGAIKVKNLDDLIDADLRMINDSISIPVVLEGTLPTKAGECAISEDAMDKYDLSVGDTVEISSLKKFPLGFIKEKELTVTAKIEHPIAFRPNSCFFVLLPKDAFETGMLGELYTNVHIDADISGDIGLLDEKYFDEISVIKDRLQTHLSDNLDTGFLIMTRNDMDGFSILRSIMTILKMLATIFVVIFFAIGIIVVLSTITIIISGQKNLIGAMRAIGFRKGEIASGYILFGASAVLFGMVLSVLQEVLLQAVLFREMGSMFIVAPQKMSFQPTTFVVLLLIEVAMACLVALFVTFKSALSFSAVELMSGNTGKAIKSEAKAPQNGRIYSRLIFRNMKTDLARVVVSVVIIAGSALMIGVGFTLNNALNNMMVFSAREITHYDMEVSCDNNSADALADLEEELKERGFNYEKMEKTATFLKYDGGETHAYVISADNSIYPAYMELNDMKKTPVVPAENGVLVGNRISEKYHINVGDKIQIYDGTFSVHVFPVEGIVRCYYGAPVIVSPHTYEEIFGREPQGNTLLIRAGDEDKASLEEEWTDKYPDLSIALTDEMPNNYKGLTRIFSVLVVIMTGLSIMMSVFVLLNLVNIFVQRRQNELIVMRVNGFSFKEGIGYLLKETVATTLLGIAFGVAVGCAMTEFLVRVVEAGDAMFVRQISPQSWILASVIEGSFALIINFFAFRKVKDLQLTDITK